MSTAPTIPITPQEANEATLRLAQDLATKMPQEPYHARRILDLLQSVDGNKLYVDEVMAALRQIVEHTTEFDYFEAALRRLIGCAVHVPDLDKHWDVLKEATDLYKKRIDDFTRLPGQTGGYIELDLQKGLASYADSFPEGKARIGAYQKALSVEALRRTAIQNIRTLMHQPKVQSIIDTWRIDVFLTMVLRTPSRDPHKLSLINDYIQEATSSLPVARRREIYQALLEGSQDRFLKQRLRMELAHFDAVDEFQSGRSPAMRFCRKYGLAIIAAGAVAAAAFVVGKHVQARQDLDKALPPAVRTTSAHLAQ